MARDPNQGSLVWLRIVVQHRCRGKRIWRTDNDEWNYQERTLHREGVTPIQEMGGRSPGFAPFGFISAYQAFSHLWCKRRCPWIIKLSQGTGDGRRYSHVSFQQLWVDLQGMVRDHTVVAFNGGLALELNDRHGVNVPTIVLRTSQKCLPEIFSATGAPISSKTASCQRQC